MAPPQMKHTCDQSKSIVINGQYKTGCPICLPTATHKSAVFAAKYHRDRQRENHRADLVQRWDGDKPSAEFARLYEKTAREQWGDDTVNELLRGSTNGRE